MNKAQFRRSFYTYRSKLIQLTHEGMKQLSSSGKQPSSVFSLSAINGKLNLSKLYSYAVNRYHLRSGFLNQAFPGAIVVVAIFSGTAREDTRATHGGAYRGSVVLAHSHNSPVCCCCTEASVSHWHHYHTGQQVTDEYGGTTREVLHVTAANDCVSNIVMQSLHKITRTKLHLVSTIGLLIRINHS